MNPMKMCWSKLPQASKEVAERNARNATEEAKRKFGSKAREITAYECPVCGYHHLTSNKGGK